MNEGTIFRCIVPIKLTTSAEAGCSDMLTDKATYNITSGDKHFFWGNTAIFEET